MTYVGAYMKVITLTCIVQIRSSAEESDRTSPLMLEELFVEAEIEVDDVCFSV